MVALLEIEATITERGQITLPSAIRKMLGIEARGLVVFRGMEDGSVVITPKAADSEDPILADFLAFLEADMQNHPGLLRPLSQDLLDRTDALVGGMEVDLDAPLTDD
jgi:antitoxin PrlF